jgi:uncharacterized protein YbjT (DUF2867 family)
MIKTLVTGGTGFVGSHIVRKLVEGSETVVVLTRNPDFVRRERRVPGAFYMRGDIFDSESLDRAVEGCDAIINAVQFENAPMENPRKGRTYERVDGEGTERQVASAKKKKVGRFIYISGAGTREGRSEPWFRGKLRAERAVRESGMNWTIFRPSWIYGPDDWSLNRFAMFARLLPFVPLVGSGRERIQPIFVKDVGEIVFRGLNDPATFGKSFDLGGPEEMAMKEIVRTLLGVLRKRRVIIPIPKSIVRPLAAVLKNFPGPPLTPDGIDFITMEEKVDILPLLQWFEVRPTALEKALQQYVGDERQIEREARTTRRGAVFGKKTT